MLTILSDSVWATIDGMIGKNSAIAVVGAGAIGGVTAALLHRAGYNVQVVCNSPELAQRITQKGLHISGLKGDFHASLPAVARASELDGKQDIVLMAVKAVDLERAAGEILPLMKEDSLAVSMQNGICEPALAEVLGRERVLGCIVGWGATYHAPGELEITASGPMILGNIFDPADERLPALAEVLRSVYPVRISHNMLGHRYAKLVINSCIASMGVLCGLPLGRMLAVGKARNIMIAVIRECMAVADAMEIKVEPFFGRLDYHSFASGSGWYAGARRHLLLRLVGFRYRRLRSSSLTSLRRGRRTEIAYLNGYVARMGREYGVPTPVNDTVVAMVEEIEEGMREVSPGNFADRRFTGL